MRRVLLAVALALLAVPASASAVTIQEFPLSTPGALAYLESGPDGNLWVADRTGAIRRVSTAGAVLTPLPASLPQDIAVGPSGNVYWTQSGPGGNPGGAVVRVTRDGLRTTQPLPNLLAYAIAVGPNERVTVSGRLQGGPYADTAGLCLATFAGTENTCGTNLGTQSQLTSLVYAADSRLWGVLQEAGQLQQFQADPPDGTPQPSATLTLPGTSPSPARAVRGPDGNLWVTLGNANAIERINVSPFERTRFPLPGAGKTPGDIAVGPDGALWFTEADGNAIGRITTSGQVTEFPVPTAGSRPFGIAVGADGAIWFTENATGALGRLTLTGPAQPGGPVGPGGPSVVADHTPPAFTTALRVTRASFRAGSGASRGTTFRYALSEAGGVQIVLARKRSGRRVRGRCVEPTRRNRRRSRCDRYVTVGTLRSTGQPGANTLRFTGRLDGRNLPAGTYRATAVATDAAGNVSRPSRVTFTVRSR
jgi:streptogramin lyase